MKNHRLSFGMNGKPRIKLLSHMHTGAEQRVGGARRWGARSRRPPRREGLALICCKARRKKLNPKPQILNPKTQPPDPEPRTTNPKHQTPNYKLQTLNTKFMHPNLRPQTPSTKPQTPNPRSKTRTPNARPLYPNAKRRTRNSGDGR